MKEEEHEMNVYEPCLFNKYAVNEEAAVDGGTIALGEFVGCVLLEVDDHLLGGPEGRTIGAWGDPLQRIKCGRWHPLLQDGRPFSEGAAARSGPTSFQGRHDEVPPRTRDDVWTRVRKPTRAR